ncbi:hypothetical protein, partial [Pseudomonas shirazensis]
LDMSAPSVTLAPAVVAASAAAATAAEKPVVPVAPVVPVVEAEPEAQADTTDPLLAQVDLSLARGRLNHAADLLEPAVAAEPERSDLR